MVLFESDRQDKDYLQNSWLLYVDIEIQMSIVMGAYPENSFVFIESTLVDGWNHKNPNQGPVV